MRGKGGEEGACHANKGETRRGGRGGDFSFSSSSPRSLGMVQYTDGDREGHNPKKSHASAGLPSSRTVGNSSRAPKLHRGALKRNGRAVLILYVSSFASPPFPFTYPHETGEKKEEEEKVLLHATVHFSTVVPLFLGAKNNQPILSFSSFLLFPRGILKSPASIAGFLHIARMMEEKERDPLFMGMGKKNPGR